MLTVTLVSLVPGSLLLPSLCSRVTCQLSCALCPPPPRLFVTCFPSQQLLLLSSSPFLNFKLPALQMGQERRCLGDLWRKAKTFPAAHLRLCGQLGAFPAPQKGLSPTTGRGQDVGVIVGGMCPATQHFQRQLCQH